MKCRHCGGVVHHNLVDLGTSPPSNAYVTARELDRPETYYPLRVKVCDHCWLVQTEDYARADELFREDYAYFSSTSASWLAHARRYADDITARLGLNARSLVIEVASNDGYLLKNFVAAGIPCLGIEPTQSTADAARALSIPVLQEFFGEALGRRLRDEGRQADLIVGNNVYAHVPDINDFTRGLKAALKPGGTITLEFPHLLRLMQGTLFDTIYHEHYSYLSLYTVQRILGAAGLRASDVEELGTHGGSLRVYACHADDGRRDGAAVAAILQAEAGAGLRDLRTYAGFQRRVDAIKNDFLAFLLEQKRAGRRVAGYGAAAKGNTLLNYAGVRPDLLPWVCDAAEIKQGKYLPGSRIPIHPPARLREEKPDIVIIFPWNIEPEVRRQHGYIAEWGGRFAVAVPELRVQ